MSGELKALEGFRRWLKRRLDDSDVFKASAAEGALAMLDDYMAEREVECPHCAAGDAYHWLGHPTVEKRP